MTMLARLESGVSRLEIFGTATVLLVFGALELFLLSWLFENKLIKTGQGLRLVNKKVERRTVLLKVIFIVIATVVVVFAVPRKRTSAPGPKSNLTAALRTHGESLFKTACVSCHEPAVERAPTREQLASFTPERVVETLTSGSMQPMAPNLSAADIRAVATYLTGRQPIPSSAGTPDPPRCSKPDTFSMSGGNWNGWGFGPRNWRFQPHPNLTVADIPRLKVKWAFSYVGGKYGQPTLVGGRLFLTSTGGAVYSLDAKTGCMFWRFAQSAPSRTTISVGPAPGIAPSGYAAYFGDVSANVYAVDAASGALLWKTRVDSHPRAVLTGSPTLFENRLYVPVSSWEEGVASVARYSCCTFRGSVVALDTATGKTIWKAYAIEQPSAPTRKNSAGTQMYGPAGAAVWSAPTIDAKRHRLYFTTGNSYTDAVDNGSDAVIAVNLASGRVVWRHQFTRGDNTTILCPAVVRADI